MMKKQRKNRLWVGSVISTALRDDSDDDLKFFMEVGDIHLNGYAVSQHIETERWVEIGEDEYNFISYALNVYGHAVEIAFVWGEAELPFGPFPIVPLEFRVCF